MTKRGKIWLALAGVAALGVLWTATRFVENVDTLRSTFERAPTAPSQALDLLSTRGPLPASAVAPVPTPSRLGGGAAGLAALALSPDGTRLAGAGHDGVVRLWSRAGEPLATVEGHHGLPATVVAFTPGGSLVSAGLDSEVRVWTLDDSELTPALDLRGHEHAVNALSMSPDGTRFASAGQETRIMLWDGESGRLENILNGHVDFVNDVAFAPDGERLASAGNDRQVLIWDVAAGEVAQRLGGHTAAVNAVRFTPDGRSVASAAQDGRIIVWDLSSGLPLRELSGRQGPVWSIAINSDGRLLASAGPYRDVQIWDLGSGEIVASLVTESQSIEALRFGAGSELFVAGAGNALEVWDAAAGTRLAQWELN